MYIFWVGFVQSVFSFKIAFDTHKTLKHSKITRLFELEHPSLKITQM